MNTEEISSKAFAIYRDHFVRDVNTKNQELEAVNESMEPAKKLLTSVRIYQSSMTQQDDQSNNIWKEFSLLDNHEETDNHLVYHEAEQPGRTIPIDQLLQLKVKISGYKVGSSNTELPLPFRVAQNPPRITVNHEIGTVEMEYYCCPTFCIVGEVTNLSGSLKEVQKMVDSNRVMHYFQNLAMIGAINALTGQPIHRPVHDTCLDGSIFVLRSIKILRDDGNCMYAEDIIDAVKPVYTDNKYKEDTFLEGLELLSKVEYGNCEEVNVVALKRKDLLISNATLQSAREWVEEFLLHIPCDDDHSIISVNFLSGCLDTCVFDDVPVMKFEVTEEDASHLPTDSIMGLSVELGQYMSGSPKDSFPAGVVDEDGIWFRCGSNIALFFAYDESANLIDLVSREETIVEYSFSRFLAYMQHLDMSEEPNLTMRLKYVAIDMDMIREQLNVLGAETEVDMSS